MILELTFWCFYFCSLYCDIDIFRLLCPFDFLSYGVALANTPWIICAITFEFLFCAHHTSDIVLWQQQQGNASIIFLKSVLGRRAWLWADCSGRTRDCWPLQIILWSKIKLTCSQIRERENTAVLRYEHHTYAHCDGNVSMMHRAQLVCR